MAYDTSKNSHWVVGDCWRCLKFIASFYEKLCLSNGKYYNERTVNDSDQSMTDVFEVLVTVNDWFVWGSCYGQWRKSVTDVLLEVKLTSVLPLCPAPTMRLALVLHPLKCCTKCSVNDESGQSLTKVCPPGAWSKRDRVPALFEAAVRGRLRVSAKVDSASWSSSN